MTSKFKALVFDLGGVLLERDRHSIDAISPEQLRAMADSAIWHSLDRGNVTLKEACQEFGNMLGEDPSSIETALAQAQLSLKPVTTLIRTIQDIKAAQPHVKFYIMSNISQDHLEIFRTLDFPWSLFDKFFASCVEGMRKPDLCFFDHVIKEIGARPDEILMVDNAPENICAARSKGMNVRLVHEPWPIARKSLLVLLLDPIQRAEAFLKDNAREHHSLVEDQEELKLKDNFTQLMIWELTGDDDIIYLKWPYGRTRGLNSLSNDESMSNSQSNGNISRHPWGYSVNPFYGTSFLEAKVENGLWNYFCEDPVLTTRGFPADADTTATAYLSLPEPYLATLPDVQLVMNKMCENLDVDGIMQVYFDSEKPRTVPEVCCNILRLFHKFGFGSDPRAKKTEDYVLDCLSFDACLYGTRHYSTPESFYYFVARLYAETSSHELRKRLLIVRFRLKNRMGKPANPLALALRLRACQLIDMEPVEYVNDLVTLLFMQEEDGGWPAGHFCHLGSTGTRIGNRGLTTALAVTIIRQRRRVLEIKYGDDNYN